MIINMCPMARKSLSPSPPQSFVDASCCRPSRPKLHLRNDVMAGAGRNPLRPEAARPRAGSELVIFSSTVWSDVAVRQRGSSPGFLPAYSLLLESPGQLGLPIPTPAGLSFLGAGIVSTVYLARCESSHSWDMYSGAACFFPLSLSFLCFLLVVFLFKCVKWRVLLPPSPFPLQTTDLQLIKAGNLLLCQRGEWTCACMCVCVK